MCLESMQSKMQEEEKAKTHHDYHKFAKEKERPENELPEEMIIDRKMTYSLKNGKSSRELSLNKVILEMSTYPLKESVIGM